VRKARCGGIPKATITPIAAMLESNRLPRIAIASPGTSRRCRGCSAGRARGRLRRGADAEAPSADAGPLTFVDHYGGLRLADHQFATDDSRPCRFAPFQHGRLGVERLALKPASQGGILEFRGTQERLPRRWDND
jgi:hypothetical protein